MLIGIQTFRERAATLLYAHIAHLVVHNKCLSGQQSATKRRSVVITIRVSYSGVPNLNLSHKAIYPVYLRHLQSSTLTLIQIRDTVDYKTCLIKAV